MSVSDISAPAPALVLILGLGETGIAAARWCARSGARLRVADTRAEPAGLDALRAALAAQDDLAPEDQDPDHVQEQSKFQARAEAEFHLGLATFDASLLDGVTQVVISPGLAPNQAPALELLEAAAARGIEVIGEIELFARALAALADSRDYHPRVLAVTGTNGKTTVTALARHLVEAAGLSARAAGNISPAALAALMDALDENDLPQVWVLELSSFQLHTTHTLSADAAVVLNVTQDHLDWHGDMQAYAAAKARLLGMARIAIINRDDPLTVAMVERVEGLNVRTIGRDAPTLVGDLGLDQASGVAWLAACEPSDFDIPVEAPKRRKKDAPPPSRDQGRLSRLMPVDALLIRGLHNATNTLAACALARAIDLGWAPLLRAAREYEGEPLRVEFVRSIGGVDYINDSKGTNVGATVAALDGLGQQVVLIAGGLGKGQDFSPLVAPVARHARAVVLIGKDGPEIGSVLESTGVSCVFATDMRDAIRQAHGLAQAGDAVLLSPACASMDMFRSYVHRGQVYTEEVQELALDQGEVA
ncbi:MULTISPECIES: UDP-N-acetylmuramoyl-L-alanine--D-glutamate ligase [unclassified Achromobacter]|uniref:UDP-N-acetylmuramoyl-L-alanine--D-glutamate ligase n=1 Tax=unclassified Achromobacter TaxID=2626865 RepID=UPI000B51C039|nr:MULTISPECIES: UDP-N-acetylmuramoyl-L-alanine--D-glutamate ligase [unclassified Achromobacter]OWT72669.1 UDP-N-acetylmuramoyl-L-alanine--D-glutamate ligase [Achromobacter sp. HZ34]OWT73886.1 UDP-N-acetylmuramoyl-L-alanine--D-glutamate ligase [Achromobacter sp. HZ28]